MDVVILIVAFALALGIIMATWWREETPCSVCKGERGLYPWACPICDKERDRL
jgi:hypothetical protein